MKQTMVHTATLAVLLISVSACASQPYYPPSASQKSSQAKVLTQQSNNQAFSVTERQVEKKRQVESAKRYQVNNRRGAYNQGSYSAQGKHFGSFEAWKRDFERRAAAQGYELSGLLANARLNQGVINSDKKQAEFMKMPWAYVDSAVSSSRVNGGRKKYGANRGIFNRIRSTYGVDPAVVAAIWGMESSYGGFTGSANLASSLASLAYEGRRRDFAEKELIALAQLLQRGDVRWQAMKGSWAGGMGHTQFIPGTWIIQGVDADRDGRKNPWSMADALNSTANYLSNSGWQANIRPVYEVNLPRNLNHRLIGATQTASQWRSQGVRFSGNSAPSGTALTLWLPAGIHGPALLTSKNFDVIKVYNNSSSYALGVSLLAQRIARRGSLQASWPRHEQPLATYQVEQLQRILTSRGYDTKGADGVIGSNTRKAFARWQADNGHVPDGFICKRTTARLLR